MCSSAPGWLHSKRLNVWRVPRRRRETPWRLSTFHTVARWRPTSAAQPHRPPVRAGPGVEDALLLGRAERPGHVRGTGRRGAHHFPLARSAAGAGFHRSSAVVTVDGEQRIQRATARADSPASTRSTISRLARGPNLHLPSVMCPARQVGVEVAGNSQPPPEAGHIPSQPANPSIRSAGSTASRAWARGARRCAAGGRPASRVCGARVPPPGTADGAGRSAVELESPRRNGPDPGRRLPDRRAAPAGRRVDRSCNPVGVAAARAQQRVPHPLRCWTSRRLSRAAAREAAASLYVGSVAASAWSDMESACAASQSAQVSGPIFRRVRAVACRNMRMMKRQLPTR
jgi:hypothetical protein